jgi:hypothetical protein
MENREISNTLAGILTNAPGVWDCIVTFGTIFLVLVGLGVFIGWWIWA